MRFSERFSLATKAFAGLFSDSAAQTAAHGLVAQVFSPGSTGMISGRSQSQRELLGLYSESPLLRMVTHRIAESVSSATWRLYAAKGKRERYVSAQIKTANSARRKDLIAKAARSDELTEVEAHPLLDLLCIGTPVLPGDLTLRISQVMFDIAGEVFYLIERNASGVPFRAWVLPPHWIHQTPTVDDPSFWVSLGNSPKRVPESEIVWLRDPDPVNPYGRGVGTARSLADELEADEAAAKHIRGSFAGGLRPDVLIMGSGLKKEKREEYEHQWHSRLRTSYSKWLPFYQNAPNGTQIHQLSQDFRSMQLQEVRQWERDLVMQTFGINPEILGHVTGSNRSTSFVAERNYRNSIVIPRLETFRRMVQFELVPEYQSPRSLLVEYELDQLVDEEAQDQARIAAPWAATVNEHREAQGLEPLDGSAGDVHLVPINLVSRPTLDAPAPLVDTERSAKAITKSPAERPFYAALHQIAQTLEPETRQVFEQAVRDLEAAFESIPERDLLRALSAGNESVAASQILALLGFGEVFREALAVVEGTLLQVTSGAGANAAEVLVSELGLGRVDLDRFTIRAAAAARNVAGEQITIIVDDTLDGIREIISTGFTEGRAPARTAQMLRNSLGLDRQRARRLENYIRNLNESRPAHLPPLTDDQLERAIRREYDRLVRQRALVVARTENLAAANAGQNELWREAIDQGLLPEGDYLREWIRVPLETECPICESYEGQMVGVNGRFSGEAGSLDGPPAHPNCLCAVRLRRVDV